MQNKGAIRLFTILLSLACVYYMMFTYITRGVEADAAKFAEEFVSTAKVQEAARAYAPNDTAAQRFYRDSLAIEVTNNYLDSMKKVDVYNLFITKFTYQDAKEQELNLGLDLQGGMNVTLEVSVADIIRGLSNNNPDAAFNQALVDAGQKQKTSTKDFVTLFGESYSERNPNAKLAPIFQTIELKGKINFNTPDNEVLKFLRDEIDRSIETAETTLRARIDKFGVTQPIIQKLEQSGRILVELPGVSDKARVRKLLQGTANLEFWETYENKEVYPYLEQANKMVAAILSPVDTAAATPDSLKATPDSLKAVAAGPDSTKKAGADTSGSLASKLGLNKTADDTNKAKLNADTGYAKYVKENPLYSMAGPLFPSVYQDEKQQYILREGPVVGRALPKDTEKVNKYLAMPKIKSLLPPRMKFLWSFKPEKGGQALELYAIRVTRSDMKAPLSGDIIADANKEFLQEQAGRPSISMRMTAEAGIIWKKLTADNKGKSIAIVLDNNVYSAPTVQNEIPNGQSSITGDFTVREADDLVNILKAGKLPAPARIVQETVVGPTLGKEAISAGLISCVMSLIVVMLFMGFYYSKSGWVANWAMLVNVFFIFGILASMSAVLTLPGIAGIVLVIAMSVDANIIIFERVREELRLGKGTALAIKEGYSNAMSSIIDGHVTSLLLGIVLYVFGTGPIQGFATTLIIGIISSLFCAIFITRLIFDRWLDKNKPIAFSTKLTENAFKNININFVGKRKVYYAVSALLIITGTVFYFKNGGFNFGVDFKGGRSYVVRFDSEVPTTQAREALAVTFGMAPEVKTYGEATQLRVTTSYLIDDNSEESEGKVEAKLNEGLDKIGVKYKVLSSEKVGETVSRDIKNKAIWAILFSCLIMFVYIFVRFKKWQYGLGATAALFHDVLAVLACYTIFDGLLPFSLEIGQDFIAALLTVMGYSMTDTVVVFDRIREYLTEKNKSDLDKEEKHRVINYALNSTLSRTINTSLTIFFVLLAIFIFGGETIRGFTFALLIGIIIGTYSSICIATPVVVDFDKKDAQPKKG